MLEQFKAIILSIFMAGEPTGFAINMDNLDNLKQVSCVAQAVYGEAGNQTFLGKVAVAHVIMNRTRDANFPETPCKVAFQRGQFDYTRHIKKLNQDKPAIYQQMYDSVKATILAVNDVIPDPTRGALFFANPKVATDQVWLKKLKKMVKIDDHQFYAKRNFTPRPREVIQEPTSFSETVAMIDS